MFESMELMIAMIAVAAFMCGLLTALAVVGLVWCFRVTDILTNLEVSGTAAVPVNTSDRQRRAATTAARDRSSGESMSSSVSNFIDRDAIPDAHRVGHYRNDRYQNPPTATAVATDYLSHSAFVDIEKQMDQYRANRQNNAMLVHSDAPR